MIAQGFKPVGWVAAVAGAALGCYMLSLNVASERAELAKVERQIIAAKQEIRTLQTELGTRGRMQQLEHWNAEVLALSAPTAAQFLDNPVTLARFETRDPTLDDKAKVTMAAAEVRAPAPRPEIAAGRKLSPADYAKVAERAAAQPQSRVRLASVVIGGEEKIPAQAVKTAAVKAPAEAAAKPRPNGTVKKSETKIAAGPVDPKAPVAKTAAKAPAEAGLAGVKKAIEKSADKPAKPVARTADAKPAKAEPKPAKKDIAKTGAGA
jgi:hypothetical protein